MVFQVTTACNGPKVDPNAVDELEEYLSKCRFVGGVHDSLTVAIREQNSEEPYLTIHGGGAEFQPVPAGVVKKIPTEQISSQEHADPEEFLTDIAPFLQERCVVQTVGHDKARFPVIARQDAVSPDGEYHEDSLSWSEIDQNCDEPEN